MTLIGRMVGKNSRKSCFWDIKFVDSRTTSLHCQPPGSTYYVVVSCFITVIIDNLHALGLSSYLSLLPMWSLFLSFSLRCDIFFSLFSSPPEGEVGSADLGLLDSDGRVGVSAAWPTLS
jgi:hypothetical protein